MDTESEKNFEASGPRSDESKQRDRAAGEEWNGQQIVDRRIVDKQQGLLDMLRQRNRGCRSVNSAMPVSR